VKLVKFAANVLLAALNEDAFTAAMDTIWRIGMIWLDSENSIRLSILRHSYEEMKKWVSVTARALRGHLCLRRIRPQKHAV